MNDNKAVFAKFAGKPVLMHICNGKAEHIFAYESLDKLDIGTIINCRAENHAGGIDATFVRYAKDRTGFINKNIKGQTVLPLMYKKEAWGDKNALFTDKLTLDGSYAVIIEGECFVKVSSKIDDANKDRYIERFVNAAKKNKIGIIIRTKTDEETGGIDKAAEEIDLMLKILSDIRSKAMHTPAYTVLYRPLPEFIKDLLYLCDKQIEEIITDDPDIRAALECSYECVLNGPVNITDRVGLRWYEDDLLQLCNLYSFNAKISEVLSGKVYLKSGAYITFDRTEALWAVDVNSSSNSYGRAKEDTFLRINIEAADEIARQLVLRNLSGVIVVDFINMKNKGDYDVLKEKIKERLSFDPKDTRFVDFTALGLCEITRKRSGRSLHEILKISDKG